ncbi:multidrug resistance-associated protein 1-like [Galendromus occidentalis]|uniref:Multidrug resistance-associated protein 1-like n=1 Tax=Galendromus occidentalis TaxID=34638 RepID=A0AAJ7WJ64_9ACAR|nr:multidrug resistance-associated protein 1-like [Galendromus occidentalis]
MTEGLYIVGVLLASQQIFSILRSHTFGTLFNVGIKLKSGLSSAIYQKCLRLSSKSSKEYPTGDIVSLITIDVDIIQWAMIQSNYAWGAPVSVVLTFALIYQYLGVYCLAGALAIVAFTPVIVLMTKIESALQTKHMKKKDQRIEMVTEVFNNVKVIKLYAWENSFMQKIRKLRDQESRLMYIYLGASNAFGFTWNCYPFFVSTAAIGAYMFLNKEGVLNPKIVLVSIAYFNSLRDNLITFPYSVSSLAKAFVSMRRIQDFLEADEVDPSIIKEELEADEDISFRNASFTWGDDENPVLKNLNFSIKKGELVAVVGSVAAGKSSLIQAIIGELIPTSGSVSRRKERKIGYVPQQAWILNSTVRKNILFGCAYAARRYRDIVKECCLLPDLKILQAGDSTEIGEKGVNLSGGQKQRVSLARAVYLDADIYLLDDPLSAVDAHVAYDLFNDVVGPKGILSGKTRILVTHSVAVLPHVDRIIVLEDGEVTHRGTYDEIMSQNVRLKELVETHANTGSENSVHDEVSRGSDEPSTRFRKRTRSVDSVSSNVSGCVERQMPDIPFGKLIEEEEMEVGVVRWRVYFEFLWHFGIIGTILGLTCYALSKAADLWSLLYITTYSKEIEIKNGTTPEDMWSHMQIYIAIGSSQGVAMLAALTALSLGCIWTSTSLHNKMLDAVMKAPMSFFDATPTGRILNR